MEQNDMSLPLTMKTPKSQLITEQQPTRKKKKKKKKLKRYLTPKDKEKASMRQRESSEPQIILPSLKIWQWKEEPPENLALKGSRIWSQEFHRTRGNRNSILGGNILSLIHISTLGKKQWSHKRLGQTYLLVLRVSCRGGKYQWLTVGIKTLAVIVLGSMHWHEPTLRPPFSSKDLAPHNSL